MTFKLKGWRRFQKKSATRLPVDSPPVISPPGALAPKPRPFFAASKTTATAPAQSSSSPAKTSDDLFEGPTAQSLLARLMSLVQAIVVFVAFRAGWLDRMPQCGRPGKDKPHCQDQCVDQAVRPALAKVRVPQVTSTKVWR